MVPRCRKKKKEKEEEEPESFKSLSPMAPMMNETMNWADCADSDGLSPCHNSFAHTTASPLALTNDSLALTHC